MVNVSQEYVSNGMTYVPEKFLEEILNEMEKAGIPSSNSLLLEAVG
ncbi:hypothetical protein [Paenibacillus sp. LjRoot56]